MASDVDGTRLTALEEKIKDLESELAGMRSHLSALLAGLVDFGALDAEHVDAITARAVLLAQKTSQGAQAATAQIVNDAAHISFG